MTIIDVKRDPITRHYTVTLRFTEEDALDLARRIVAEAESDITVTTDTTTKAPTGKEPT